MALLVEHEVRYRTGHPYVQLWIYRNIADGWFAATRKSPSHSGCRTSDKAE